MAKTIQCHQGLEAERVLTYWPCTIFVAVFLNLFLAASWISAAWPITSPWHVPSQQYHHFSPIGHQRFPLMHPNNQMTWDSISFFLHRKFGMRKHQFISIRALCYCIPSHIVVFIPTWIYHDPSWCCYNASVCSMFEWGISSDKEWRDKYESHLQSILDIFFCTSPPNGCHSKTIAWIQHWTFHKEIFENLFSKTMSFRLPTSSSSLFSLR